jgi:hypothetical protein
MRLFRGWSAFVPKQSFVLVEMLFTYDSQRLGPALTDRAASELFADGGVRAATSTKPAK